MSSHHDTPNHVMILGGGVTGLSAAFHLARKHPTLQITLVEKSTRFGGWIRSERVEVCDSDGNRGRVLLEAGPRTVRPNAKSILELIHFLDLRSEVIYTPRGSPAARNRFLHVPPAEGLQPLPSSLLSLITRPLGRLVLRSVLAEAFVPANRPQPQPPAPETTTAAGAEATTAEAEEDDESVDSFLSRRFGDAFARTLGSALVHGIYAADSRLLSVRAAFPMLCDSEARGNGSVVWGELGPPAWFGWRASKAKSDAREQEQEGKDGEETTTEVDREWETRFRAGAALFSFKEGMETLVGALVEALRGFSNVTLRSGTAARRIDAANDGDDEGLVFQIYLDTKDAEDKDAAAPLRATHVISALPLPVLDSILQQPADNRHTLPHLCANPHSSVTVLNLVFPETTLTSSSPLHPPGFGYLIPRPEQGYDHPVPSALAAEEPGSGPEPVAVPEQEDADPELGLLGVVFDTASLPEQDSDSDDATAGTARARFIKLTAMLGGPYASASASDASNARLVEVVLRRLSVHLGRPLPQPVHYVVHRNVESIPTYLVGHTARMGQLRRALRERWGGRMKVVGAGVGGVSVADCVKAGRQAAFEVDAQIRN